MMSDVGNEGRGWYGECPQAEEAPYLTASEIERGQVWHTRCVTAGPGWILWPIDDTLRQLHERQLLSGEAERLGTVATDIRTNTAIERMERNAEAMKAEEARLA